MGAVGSFSPHPRHQGDCSWLLGTQSTLPGFMRPRGSSVALSCRIVSTPTSPTSSCSSCRLPSPMPCSPVHVPWSASARLQGAGKRASAWSWWVFVSTSPGCLALSLPADLPSCFAKVSTLRSSSGSSGSTSKMQWKLPSPTCPTMAPGGPEETRLPPCRLPSGPSTLHTLTHGR